MLFVDSKDVARMLDYPGCIGAVESAFRDLGLGKAEAPVVCGIHVPGGGFHVKAAALGEPPSYFVAKTNANFPANPALHGLPTIQGVALLFDARNGTVLAALDSGEITVRRTAAATAVAAKHLARPDASVMTVCGCGVQGRAHVRALAEVLPISTVFAYDVDGAAAERLAEELAGPLGIEIHPVRDLGEHARVSDVCVTCTSARTPVLGPDDVRPGSFVAGVGADSPEKSELAPELLARSRVVADVATQCAAMGDLGHAIRAGLMAVDAIHAELGEVVAGRRPGRQRPDETFVFDSTGTAIQDVAAAALVYERIRAEGGGRELVLDPGGRSNLSPSPRT